MRGLRSYGRKRDLLHVNKLDAFKAWCERKGLIILESPEKAIYEALRLDNPADTPGVPHIIFYLRNGAQHVTVPKEGVELVREFIREARGE
jgi:hypothetical protein